MSLDSPEISTPSLLTLAESDLKKRKKRVDFPRRPVDKNPRANVGDTGSVLGVGRLHVQQSR